jgi:hypothetical protein
VGGQVGSMLIDYVRAYELKEGAAPAATQPNGAGLITYSVGALAPGGTPARNDSFTYLADTTGRVEFRPQDFNFASNKAGSPCGRPPTARPTAMRASRPIPGPA